jgi:hypothetical protein
MSASSARTLRRAAQREVLKAARIAARETAAGAPLETSETPDPPPSFTLLRKPLSQAQLDANRANSLKSTGPKTTDGKAAVRYNAVKTALTGHTVMLPSDDAILYRAHITAYEKQFKPVGPEECALVQSIADIRWRLNRLPGLEMALMIRGRLQVAHDIPELANTDQIPMLEIGILLRYQKEFRNLQLQEARLARRREKEMVELRRLQQERKSNEAPALERATTAYLLARHRSQPSEPAELGFEFSKQTFDAHLASLTPLRQQELLQKALADTGESMQAAA